MSNAHLNFINASIPRKRHKWGRTTLDFDYFEDKSLNGFTSDSFNGYVYAPYIPLTYTPQQFEYDYYGRYATKTVEPKWYSDVMEHMTLMANKIAEMSMKSAASYIVVSPDVAEKIQEANSTGWVQNTTFK